MVKLSNRGTRIWFDAVDLSGSLNAAEQNVKQSLVVVTTFADSGPRRILEDYDHDHSHTALFDAAHWHSGGVEQPSLDHWLYDLAQAPDVSHYLAHLFGANAEGSPCYESVVHFEGQPRSAALGQAILVNLTSQGAGPIARGCVLRNATIEGNGNGTGRNCGATLAGQVTVATFRVFAGTFSHLDLKVQESQNDGAPDAYADVAGLSAEFAVADTPGIVRATTTAATEAWKRCVVSNFVGTSALVGVTLTVEAPSAT